MRNIVRNILAIAGKEFGAYFGAPSFYLIIAVFLFVAGYGFGWTPAAYQATTIQGFLGWSSFLLLFLGPALTMRLLAEEEKLGTIELLLTAPVRDVEVVLGKYLAALGMLVVMLIFTLYYPILLAVFGDPDWGPILSGYLGIFLVGAVFLSVGIFTSSLTSNQIVASTVGCVILISLWNIQRASSVVGETADKIFRYISLSSYFPAFGRGVIDSNAIVYYVSIVVVFLFLTIRSLETRRWR